MRAVLDTRCLFAQYQIHTAYARSIKYTVLVCAVSEISSLRAH